MKYLLGFINMDDRRGWRQWEERGRINITSCNFEN